MESGIMTLVMGLAVQFPLWGVYILGLLAARHNRRQQPGAMRRLSLAVLILLLDGLGLNSLSLWLPGILVAQAASYETINAILFLLALFQNLLRAWAFVLMLRAIFPEWSTPSWVRRLAGGIAGLLVGTVLALLAGDGIGGALGITTFEGARGYFVVFVLVPIFALVGALAGAMLIRGPGVVRGDKMTG